MLEKDRHNGFPEKVIGAAIAVHHEVGPGLLETAYEACLAYELMDRGIFFVRQKSLPLGYRGVRMDCAYRVDLLVEDAQLRSYLRLSGCKVGLLLNFNVKWFTAEGIKRVVNDFPE